MKKSITILAYIIIFSLVAIVLFFIPQNTQKISGEEDFFHKKTPYITFYKVDSFYEEREEDQNRRVITVYVDRFIDDKEVWMKIFDYANKLPLTWGGFTAVFFFNNRDYTPLVTYFTERFDTSYEDHCIAGYWKYSNGTDIFRQYPFKN
ncbi:MAG: hypothetical protein JXJ04_07190 [Spirochaetales bacterium]|nr:hypothetical protein [Spirochaetales bacterium]